MMRTIAAALVAAAIAVCTAGGATAQNSQPIHGPSPPLLTAGDIGADFTGFIVTQPTFVLVVGDSNICPDAVARVRAAAKGLNSMSVIFAKPQATSKTKDMSWALVFTPGFDDRVAQARTYGKAEFNACEYGDGLAKFLSTREVYSNGLLSADRTLKRTVAEQESVLARLVQIDAIPVEQRSSRDNRDLVDLAVEHRELTGAIAYYRKLIDAVLEQEGGDARLRPELLSPQ